MKKIFTILAALCFAAFASAQYYYVPAFSPGNPGGVNDDDQEYPVGGGLPTTWTTILGPSNASPAWSSVESIPFAFEFNGNAVTDYKVSSSGVLTFTTSAATAPSYSNSAIPNAAIPDNSIMVWGIAGTGTNDNIVTQVWGNAPNRQLWVFFSSYTAGNWTYWSIVLEETSNHIYIVDMRHATDATPAITAGIQIDGATAVSVAGSPNLSNLAQQDPTAADNHYYEFIYGSQPDYDMAGVSVNMDDFLMLSQAPFDVQGTVQNLGAMTITSYDINYSIDNGPTVTAPVNGVNIAPFGTDDFTSSMTWNPGSTGAYDVKIWASNLNGNSDQNTANDAANKNVNVVDAFTQRNPLYETFTSSTCGPCTPANENMELLIGQNPGKLISLKYQMSWPGTGDPYFTDEANVRRNYYAINSIPRMEVDGGWDENGNNLTQQVIDQFYAVPAFVELEATFIRDAGQGIEVDATITPLVDIGSNDLVCHIAVFEETTYNNVKTNGETEFFHVMKKMLPDEQGTDLAPFVANTPVTVNESYTFQGSYRLSNNATDPINHAIEHSVEEFDDLGVVVWVQDMATKEVLQAAYAVEDPLSSIEENKNELVGKVFPNPANDLATVSFNLEQSEDVIVQVFDPLGAVVFNKDYGKLNGNQLLNLDVSEFSSGIYTVQLTAGSKQLTKRITVN